MERKKSMQNIKDESFKKHMKRPCIDVKNNSFKYHLASLIGHERFEKAILYNSLLSEK